MRINENKWLIVVYWVYINICFGIFLSKNFYKIFMGINKSNFYKTIELKKKLGLKKMIKIPMNFLKKLSLNWFLRIIYKFLLSTDAIELVILSIRNFFKKSKYNLCRLKRLFQIFGEAFLILCSFVNEVTLLSNILICLIEWKNFLKLLMVRTIDFLNLAIF
jgi:hypothetical protein